MATPTIEKTYQYGTTGDPDAHINYRSYASDADAWGNLWVFIKNCFVNVASGAWTIVGSCDSTQYSMAGVDYWQDAGDIVRGGGAHSWLVLEQAGLAGGNFQVCFDYSGSYNNRMTTYVSPGGNFTGGSTSARPTASDEINVIGSTTNVFEGSPGPFDSVTHIAVSTDGAVTRLFWCTRGNCTTHISFEAVKNPESAWSNAWFVRHSCGHPAGTEGCSYEYFCDSSSSLKSYYSPDAIDFYTGTIGYSANPLGQYITGDNDDLGEWEAYPQWLCKPDLPHRGTKGQVYDCWFVPEDGGVASGQRVPAGGPYTHVVFGEMLFPWGDYPCYLG